MQQSVISMRRLSHKTEKAEKSARANTRRGSVHRTIKHGGRQMAELHGRLKNRQHEKLYGCLTRNMQISLQKSNGHIQKTQSSAVVNEWQCARKISSKNPEYTKEEKGVTRHKKNKEKRDRFQIHLRQKIQVTKDNKLVYF